MSTPCDHDALFAGLRSRSADRRIEAIDGAERDEHADQLLSRMLDETPDGQWIKVFISAALGKVSGEAGSAALRRALDATGPRTSDLRCSALSALARRCGEAAHDDFVRGLHSKDQGTRGAALIMLAAYGRDGVWDEVAAHLVSTLKRPQRRGSIPSDTIVMIVYLLRHAASDPQRIPNLVRILRNHWDGLDPSRDFSLEAADWIASHWPHAAPGGPDPADVPAPSPLAIDSWRHSQPSIP